MSVTLISSSGAPIYAVEGLIAHDAVDSGNPLKIGGKASTSAPAAVAVNDRVNAWLDTLGIQQVTLRDTSGAAIASGVQYVEDVALAANAGQGTLVLGRRDDGLSALTPVEGDAVGLRVGDKGALWVQISDGSGAQITSFGGGTQYVEDVALGAVGAATGTLSMGRAAAAAPTAVSADADAVAAWHLRSGQQVVSLAAGTALIGGDATGGLHAQGAIAHDAVDSGNPLKVGGKASTSAPTGVLVNDRVDAWFSTHGALAVMPYDNAGNALTNGAGAIRVDAVTGHDAVDAGNPIKIGGRASDTPPTQVANDDRVNARYDRRGASFARLSDADGVALRSVPEAQGSDVGVLAAGVAPGTHRTQTDNVSSVVASPAFDIRGCSYAILSTTGTFTGLTASIQMSVDGGTTWIGANQFNEGLLAYSMSSGGEVLVVSSVGRVIAVVAGYTHIRLNVTAISTGTATFRWNASATPLQMMVSPAFGLPTPIATPVSGHSMIWDPINTYWNQAREVPIADAANTYGIASVGAMVFNGSTWDRPRGDSSGIWAQGNVAHDAVDSGNPIKIGARASTAIPTAVASGDRVNLWANLNGAQLVVAAPHVGLNSDPWALVHEAAQYTTTQTSTVLVAGGASEKIVVTKVQIQAGGTVAGAVQLYFGTGAYARGTNRAIFDGEFAPSATNKPGVIMDGPFIAGTNGDDLMVTTSAAINPITISVWYYLVT